MSITNTPDPEERKKVVKQDLDSVMHPIVQHRMLEHAAELWNWLKDGAHFYVCGDARRMAKDVDETLRLIVWEQGGMTQPDVEAFMTNLTKTGRYQRDVY